MKILALSLMTTLLIVDVRSAMLLNKYIANCRHCLRIVKMFKNFFHVPDEPIPKTSLSQLLFKEIIVSECNAGEYERYVPNHTPQLCEAYYKENEVSFTHLYLGLINYKTAIQTCTEFMKMHLKQEYWICEDWMGEDELFARCDASTTCQDSDAKCCPLEKLCGYEC